MRFFPIAMKLYTLQVGGPDANACDSPNLHPSILVGRFDAKAQKKSSKMSLDAVCVLCFNRTKACRLQAE